TEWDNGGGGRSGRRSAGAVAADRRPEAAGCQTGAPARQKPRPRTCCCCRSGPERCSHRQPPGATTPPPCSPLPAANTSYACAGRPAWFPPTKVNHLPRATSSWQDAARDTVVGNKFTVYVVVEASSSFEASRGGPPIKSSSRGRKKGSTRVADGVAAHDETGQADSSAIRSRWGKRRKKPSSRKKARAGS